MEPIISVRGLGKRYSIARREGRYLALRDVIAETLRHPLRALGRKAREAVGLEGREEFWALRGVEFEMSAGEVLGIIGHNGAGKSTLLKILSQITPPTDGEIELRGRVGSLLEVGTGFHPELSGRENVFLNGAILGMTRRELVRKLDAIIEFAGIERFIDTPVKHYSSGMYVRLAFSVAAHLEPDILVVDEVLAVGDAEFQQKCLGKMEEVTKAEGRTILFVSHNMAAIRQLCARALLLSGGEVRRIGEAKQVVEEYLAGTVGRTGESLRERADRKGSGRVRIVGFSCRGKDDEPVASFTPGAPAEIRLELERRDPSVGEMDLSVGIDVVPEYYRIALMSTRVLLRPIQAGAGEVRVRLPDLPLRPGTYSMTLYLESKGDVLDWIQRAGCFTVDYADYYGTGQLPPSEQGSLLLRYDIR